jgi:hypothetical protein
MTTQSKNSELETVAARANTTALTIPFHHKTIEGKDIPEGFVNSGAEKYDWMIGARDVQMSGGFMEKVFSKIFIIELIRGFIKYDKRRTLYVIK